MPLFFRIYLLLVTLDCLNNLVVFYLQSFCVSMSKIVVSPLKAERLRYANTDN